MKLLSFVERYIAGRDVSKAYAVRIRKRSEKLAAFVGSGEVADVFNEQWINQFLASLVTLDPLTVRCYRSDVLSLWNAAADLDLVPYPVMRRIRRPKCPRLVIECFTVDDVRAILAQIERLHPYPMRTGVDRAVYWNAVVRVAWDTGLRRGDVWAFRKSWLRSDGSARVVQHKTGQVVTVKLHASTIAALETIPFDKACHWPGAAANSNRFCKQFKAIVRAAGVSRGTFKWLRRSSGSYVDMALPGSGSKHLGHATTQMFHQHYDAKLGGRMAPMPPDLGGASELVSEVSPDWQDWL